MLPQFLNQLKTNLEIAGRRLSRGQSALLNELKQIDHILTPSSLTTRDSIAPVSDQCPACGKPLN